MGRIDVLKTELTTDPLARGYAAMTDVQAADSLNTSNLTRERDAITSAELFEAIDAAEFVTLTADQKARIDRILALGEGIDARAGSQARGEVLSIFTAGAGPNTRTSLSSLVNESISRGEELSLGKVKVGEVQMARL